MKIDAGTIIAGALVLGVSAWAIVTGTREARKNREELAAAKEDRKYDYESTEKVNRKLIFDTKLANANYDADTKSDAYTLLMDLNKKCKNATTKPEFSLAYDDMEQIRTMYKRGDDVDLKALLKSIKKYYNDMEKVSSKSCDVKMCGSFNMADVLSTIRTVAALNSGITNDYYKWRLASRW